jgi:hypothetical protein
MRVVRRQARLRWLAVACGVALLCGLPAIIAAWPVPDSSVSSGTLRARILASGAVPYSGYAESSVTFNLPSLPDLGDLTTLLDGITDQYTWYLSARQWRSDVITATGENDTYQTSQGTYLWNYSSNLLVQVLGTEPFRLPRASDLLPPDLARRLLSYASGADRISRLPSQRMAGVDAAGLRLVPTDPATTVGEIEIWANPATGLPIEVTVTGRGAAQPILVTRFLNLNQSRPSPSTVTPNPGPGVGDTTTELPDVSKFLNSFGPRLPRKLAGQSRIANPGGLADVAAYGTGFARFAIITLPHSTGDHLVDSSDAVGAGEVSLPGHPFTAVITTPLVNMLVAQPIFSRRGPVFMFVGTVKTSVLVNAATALLTELREHRR